MKNYKFSAVFALLLVAFFQESITGAADFYGAAVTDQEAPTVAWRAGITGFRPIVGDVPPNSNAAKYGFKQGHVILSINGKSIRKTSELSQFTTDTISVYVFDGTEMKTLSIDRLAIEKEKAERAEAEHKAAKPPPRVLPDERPDDSPPMEFNDEILYRRSIGPAPNGTKTKEPSEKNGDRPAESR